MTTNDRPKFLSEINVMMSPTQSMIRPMNGNALNEQTATSNKTIYATTMTIGYDHIWIESFQQVNISITYHLHHLFLISLCTTECYLPIPGNLGRKPPKLHYLYQVRPRFYQF